MYTGNAEKGVVFFNILNLQTKKTIERTLNTMRQLFFFEMFKQGFNDFKFTENSAK